MVIPIGSIKKARKVIEEEEQKRERLSLFNPEFFPASVPGGRTAAGESLSSPSGTFQRVGDVGGGFNPSFSGEDRQEGGDFSGQDFGFPDVAHATGDPFQPFKAGPAPGPAPQTLASGTAGESVANREAELTERLGRGPEVDFSGSPDDTLASLGQREEFRRQTLFNPLLEETVAGLGDRGPDAAEAAASFRESIGGRQPGGRTKGLGGLFGRESRSERRARRQAGRQGTEGRQQARERRERQRFGGPKNLSGVEAQQATTSRQRETEAGASGAANEARLERFDQQDTLRRELINIGRGVQDESVSGLTEASNLQTQRESEAAARKAQKKAGRIGTITDIIGLGIGVI